MITFNGKKFVKTQKELTCTLFETGGTACGFYRVRKDGVLFMDLNKAPRVFVKFDGSSCFAVTATQTPQGIRYMFGLTSISASFIGFDNYTHRREREVCGELQTLIENNRLSA